MTKYGYINTQGEFAIKPQFLEAKDFSEQLVATVQLITTARLLKWGFINTTGELVIPAVFDETSHFGEGRCAVKHRQKWGFINDTGKLPIPHKFDTVYDFDGSGRSTNV